MGYSVIFVCDGFSRAVGSRGNRRFAFATADYFNAAMVDGYRLLLPVLIEYVMVECYNFSGKLELTEMSVLKKAIIYIHGKSGSHLEAEQYKKNCADFDIVGVDYNDYLPWIVQNQIKAVYGNLTKEYEHISIIANSIGAYFAMHTLQDCAIEKALFISPVLDMEKLIFDMMQWANVAEDELCEKGEIPTDFGETLSWEYLSFVRENPIKWDIPTEILYAEKDNLTSRATIDAFVASHNANLTVLKNSEHWFHTDEQIAYLDKWMKKAIC